MIRHFLAVIFLTVLCFNSIAQHPPYFQIGENEFANVDVYSLLYNDKTDILYAGTNRGVYAYKQNKFNLLKPSENQAGNSLFQLKKDNEGKIFCCNLRGQVFEVKERGLTLFYELPVESNIVNFRFYFDVDNNLIVNTLREILRISPDGKKEILLNIEIARNLFPDLKQGIRLHSEQLLNKQIYFSLVDERYYLKYNKTELTSHQLPNDDVNSNSTFFQLGKNVYYLLDKKIKREDGTPVNSNIRFNYEPDLAQINANLVSVKSSFLGRRLIQCEEGKIEEVPLNFQSSYVSSIATNKKGTFFLGTFSEGVFIIPNEKTISYRAEFPFKGITSSNNNDVYLSNQKGEIFRHSNGPKLYGKFYYDIDHLFHLRGSYISGLLDSIMHKQFKINFTPGLVDNTKDLFEYKDEFVLIMSAVHLNIVLSDSSKELPSDFAKNRGGLFYTVVLEGRGKSVTYLSEEKAIYYSTNKNVSRQKWNSGKVEHLLFKGVNILGNDLAGYQNNLLIASETNGILFYEKSLFKKQLDIHKGLKSNTVLKIEIHKDLLFILTTKGIQVFNLSQNKFLYLGESEGVISEKVINFALSKNNLWLLDKQGYYAYKLKNFQHIKSDAIGKLNFDSVTVNGVNVTGNNNTSFAFDENQFEFFFDYRNIETKNEALIKYKLIGASDEWTTLKTSENSVAFSSLAPGRYSFIIKAVYRGKETKKFRYDFKILPPFWFQLWFIILMIFIVVFTVSIFFFRRMKRNKKTKEIELEKQKMKADIFESKLKAIRSQMNPHFIFNCLNSIQSLVLKENKEMSYDSIEQFSELVRKTLQFSEKAFVPISEEISFLQTYLSLESLRMKDEFKFTLKNKFNRNFKIPSLLIQPFIENSIHHGLLHKDGEKRLEISFYQENNNTYCSIIDNGIGREEARVINKRQNNRHQSFSLNAMKDRLKILSQQHAVEYNYKITDLYDDLNHPIGTKVVIHFPFQDEY